MLSFSPSERTHDSGKRNGDDGHGSAEHKLPAPEREDEAPPPRKPYVDPAEEAMSHNPNMSPPIHVHAA